MFRYSFSAVLPQRVTKLVFQPIVVLIQILVAAHCTTEVLWSQTTGQAVAKSRDNQEAVGLQEDVIPLLQEHCYGCHVGADAKAGLKLDELVTTPADQETADMWLRVLQTLQFDEMPPPEEERPDPIKKSKAIIWIEHQLSMSELHASYRLKLMNPDYGNYISHELLFSGTIKTLPFSPSRLWRLSPQIFQHKGIRDAQSPFSFITSERGIRDYAAASGVDQSTVEMILINTDQLLDIWTREGKFDSLADDKAMPADEHLADMLKIEFRRAIGRLPQPEEQAKYLAFLRKNMADGGNLDGFKTTIKAMYLSTESIYRMELGLGDIDSHGRRHLSPEELTYAISYALTDSIPEQNKLIREAITANKLQNRDDVAKLVESILADGINPRNTPRVMRFFEEFFGYNQADKVFKDMSRVHQADIKQWNTNRLMYEAEQLVQYHVNRDKDVIEELLTGNRFYVAHPGDNDIARQYYDEVIQDDYAEQKVARRIADFERAKRDPNRPQEKEELTRIRQDAESRSKLVKMAFEDGLTPFPGWPYEQKSGKPIRGQTDLIYIAVYNLPPTHRQQRQVWEWPLEQPFALPADQRAGILTHPAWLAAHSVNDGNDPIRRGRWIQEKLLAGVIQDVPPDVDANVPNDPHKTLRERMEPVRAERCWRCHRKMNPLGEPFEIYDDWGRHRTEVYFDQDGLIVHQRGKQFERRLAEGEISPRKVDATGMLLGTGDPAVDGEVTNAIDLMRRLGRSARARQSFIRHLFRFLMGRNEMLSDSQTLINAETAYLKNGGSFQAMLVSLLCSDSFLYRR